MCKILMIKKPYHKQLNESLLNCIIKKGYKYGQQGFGFILVKDDQNYIIHKEPFETFQISKWRKEFYESQILAFHFRRVVTIQSVLRDYQPLEGMNYILLQAGLTRLSKFKEYNYITENNAERLLSHIEYQPHIVFRSATFEKINIIVFNKKKLLDPVIIGRYDKRRWFGAEAIYNYHFGWKDYAKCVFGIQT